MRLACSVCVGDDALAACDTSTMLPKSISKVQFSPVRRHVQSNKAEVGQAGVAVELPINALDQEFRR